MQNLVLAYLEITTNVFFLKLSTNEIACKKIDLSTQIYIKSRKTHYSSVNGEEGGKKHFRQSKKQF